MVYVLHAAPGHLEAANGVNWVHGSAIGIAASDDGKNWKYVGTCQGGP